MDETEDSIFKLTKPYLDMHVAFVQWLETINNYIRMEINNFIKTLTIFRMYDDTDDTISGLLIGYKINEYGKF